MQNILKSMRDSRGFSLGNSVYYHFIMLPSSVVLIFNLPEQIVHIALLFIKKNNCARLV